MYVDAVFTMNEALERIVGFIDDSLPVIGRPNKTVKQPVINNLYKCKHALKHQAVNAPKGLIVNVPGHVEGIRYYRTLYVRIGLEENLSAVLDFD